MLGCKYYVIGGEGGNIYIYIYIYVYIRTTEKWHRVEM